MIAVRTLSFLGTENARQHVLSAPEEGAIVGVVDGGLFVPDLKVLHFLEPWCE